MKNFKINPELTNVEFRISVPSVELTRLGWEFDAPNFEGDINLLFTNYGTDNGVVCLWSFAIDGADCEDSGDTEKSIEDVLHLLNSGIVEYDEDKDYSEDESGIYVSWFIIDGFEIVPSLEGTRVVRLFNLYNPVERQDNSIESFGCSIDDTDSEIESAIREWLNER